MHDGVYQPPGEYTLNWPIGFPNSDPPVWFDIGTTDPGEFSVPGINRYSFGYIIRAPQYAVRAYGVGW